MIEIVLPALGFALLILLGVDVLITVFHPQGRGGPINRMQMTCVWTAFRSLAKWRGEGPRSDLLSFCGPILAVLTIITWGVVLVAGFVLIYYPFIGSFHVSPPAARPDGALATAIYYSAYAASTLGVGDVVAPTAALKLLTIAESLTGFILIPISVTYVLSVYRDLSHATTLSLDLYGYFQRGTEQVWEDLSNAGQYGFSDWMDRTARDLLRITQAHSQYPILHYFHASDPAQALLVQLGHLIRFEGVSQERDASVSDSPSRDALHEAIQRHLRVINRDVVPRDFAPGYEQIREADLEAQYQRIIRYMLYEAPWEETESPEGR